MKYFFLRLVAMVICFAYLVPQNAIAGVDLPWSTSVDCPDWVQLSGSLNCQGLEKGGDWTTGDGSRGAITADANNSNNANGVGTKGVRHWVGNGTNNNSGGLTVSFNQPQPEIWIRWYMRYEQGFTWGSLNYDKFLYINVSKAGSIIPGLKNQNGSFNMFSSAEGFNRISDTHDWNKMMGGPKSDGRFHLYEIHIKRDTNGSNGIMELWVDGELAISEKNVNTGGVDFTHFLIGSNQATPDNARDMAVDFDDIAVSSTGYIGPIGSDGGIPKPPPVW